MVVRGRTIDEGLRTRSRTQGTAQAGSWAAAFLIAFVLLAGIGVFVDRVLWPALLERVAESVVRFSIYGPEAGLR